MFSQSSQKVILPFPRNPVTRLYRNGSYRMQTRFEVRELEESLRQHSDNCEVSAIREHHHRSLQLEQYINSAKETCAQLPPPQTTQEHVEQQKLQKEIVELEAEKFVTDMSACMSINTNKNAKNLHKNAFFVTRYMIKSSCCFKVSADGKIERTKRQSEIAQWDPIPEDFIVSEESDDSDDKSVFSVNSVDSVESNSE